MTEIKVRTSKEYSVVIGRGCVGNALSVLRSPSDTVLVSDSTVFSLYGSDTLKKLGIPENNAFVFPSGEKSKTPETLLSLLSFLAQRKITRGGTLVALGGGVTGDITGFAASVYMRGISYIQLPTTLLAAVDSSVGGKTAVNLPEGKNLCGTFYQPDAVFCDTSFFDTLTKSDFSCGMAEAVKCGVIAGETLFSVASEYDRKADRDGEKITEIISRCVRLKAAIVSEDETDKSGKRALLNLGHTAAHAIEKLSEETVPHGIAVAKGLALIAAASAFAGLSDFSVYEKIASACHTAGLPINPDFTAGEIASAAMNDKKALENEINLIIPKKIGECISLTLPKTKLEAFFSGGFEIMNGDAAK